MDRKYKCNFEDYKATRKESIQEMKDRMKREKILDSFEFLNIEDYYEKAVASVGVVRKRTGIVYDDEMALHKCEWDENYPECPERYFAVLQRCRELGLIQRCEVIPSAKANIKDVLKKHSEAMHSNLQQISTIEDLDLLKGNSAKFDSVYFNQATFNAASVAAGSVTALVRAIAKCKIQNGMAVVRPPGHHATVRDYCGYCFFNNVAIAAQNLLDNKLARRILIVDFDIHHGQATQQMFYKDDKVLYFSIHRYQHGKFWPHLRESNFDFIGEGAGKGYNVNVPLNDINLGDDDYINIVLHLLLPLAYEYNPDIVIFSAGYDSCIGCPEGQMILTPGFYGHLITLLGGIAGGKLAVCLEGGYNLTSLAEGAAMTLRALLDDPPVQLPPVYIPSKGVVETINNIKFVLMHFWRCFSVYTCHSDDSDDIHSVNIKYVGEPLKPPYEITGFYPVLNQAQTAQFDLILSQLKEDYMEITNGPVCYSYDDEMLEHVANRQHPETPDRLKKVYEIFLEMKLNERCTFIQSEPASAESLKLVHEETYVDNLVNGTYKPTHTDIYYGVNSKKSIRRSAGCLLSVVDNVMTKKSRSGFALIRPPGHHAETDTANGFCFINNVAVAAKHILKTYGDKRIMIIDFDIHHGNGTQHIFYSDNKVLYLSVHKYNDAKFFPTSTDANYDNIGKDEGLGYNINIPLSKEKMGDSEYIFMFYRLILPIAYAFAPDVLIISAGFDAGVNDPLGSYNVTPEAFGHFIQLLKSLAQGRIILALEGGYNVTTVAYSMNLCIKALLGDPLPKLNKFARPKSSVIDIVEKVITLHKPVWKILGVDLKLPSKIKSLVSMNEQGEEVTVYEPEI